MPQISGLGHAGLYCNNLYFYDPEDNRIELYYTTLRRFAYAF